MIEEAKKIKQTGVWNELLKTNIKILMVMVSPFSSN
jgi:hypothetical protein